MEKTTKEVNERKYMEVDIYDTDGDGFIDVCTMALSLIDSETGDTLDVTTIKKQLEKLETLIKSSDTTSKDSEKLIKDLKTLQDKVKNVERTLDSKIVSNKIEQTEQIEQVKNLIINIQNIINMKADKVHMHNEYANKTHTHSYNDLTDKPIINNNPKVNIIDNLDSTATTSALSANQGKILNGTIKEVKTSLSNVENNIKNIDLSADKVKLSGITGIQSNNVKGAIQELFINADNGKQSISNVIGEPLSATDDFFSMKGKIQALKNTLASNLTDKGIKASQQESLKSLGEKISKIKSLNENRGRVKYDTNTNELIILEREHPLKALILELVNSYFVCSIDNSDGMSNSYLHLSVNGVQIFKAMADKKGGRASIAPKIFNILYLESENKYLISACAYVSERDSSSDMKYVQTKISASDRIEIKFGINNPQKTLPKMKCGFGYYEIY